MAANNILDKLEEAMSGPDALTITDYVPFWKKVTSDPEFTSCYIVCLIGKLLLLDSGMENAKDSPSLATAVEMIRGNDEFVAVKKGGELTPEQARRREAVVNTLNFVGHHYEYDPTLPMLARAISKWIAFRGTSKREFVDSVMSDYVNRSFDSLAMTIVEQCSNVDSHLGLALPPQPIDCFLSASEMAPAHINAFLQSLVATSTQSAEIFSNILLFLKHPGIREGRLLSLLYMLESFIAMDNSMGGEELLKAVDLVKQYYLWPLPYGLCARDSLQMLVRELRAPGSTFRRRMVPETPIRGETVYAADVHVIVNTSAGHAGRLLAMLRTAPELPISPRQLRFDVINNAFRGVLSSEYPLETQNKIALLSDSAMEDVFGRVLEAMDTAVSTIDYEAATAACIKTLKSIISEAESMETSSEPPCIALPVPPTPSAKLNLLECSEDNVLNSDNGVTPASFPDYTTITTLADILESYSRPDGAAAPAGKEPAENTDKAVVRIGIVGGDGTLSNVVGSLVALRYTTPALFDGVELKFFLVPVGIRNNFAKFVARYDGWYYRHVLALSQTLMRVIPSVMDVAAEADVSAVPDSDFEVSILTTKVETGGVDPSIVGARPRTAPRSPAEIIRSELENYFLRAESQLDVGIYIAELTYVAAAKGADPVIQTIPFVDRLEIGLAAAVRSHIRAKGLDPTLPDDVVPKAMKYYNVELGLTFNEVSISGLARPGPALDMRSYWSVSIANTPRAGDRGTLAKPSSSWLEMYTLDAEAGKKLQKNRTAFVDGEHTFHVGNVEVEMKNKKGVPVLIDGEIYEGVTAVKVGPCLDPFTADQMVFPLMTYFPLDM